MPDGGYALSGLRSSTSLTRNLIHCLQDTLIRNRIRRAKLLGKVADAWLFYHPADLFDIVIFAARGRQFIEPLLPGLLHAVHFQHLRAIAVRIDGQFLQPFFNRLQITQRIAQTFETVAGNKSAIS